MAKYAVPFYTTATTWAYVEAKSPEDAVEVAYTNGEAQFPFICAQCAGWNTGDDVNTGIELSGDWELDDGDEPYEVEE